MMMPEIRKNKRVWLRINRIKIAEEDKGGVYDEGGEERARTKGD